MKQEKEVEKEDKEAKFKAFSGKKYSLRGWNKCLLLFMIFTRVVVYYELSIE